jgi:hypothetical protein
VILDFATRTQTGPSFEDQLVADVGRLAKDPLGFCEYAYPWGEPGPLEHESLDGWQVDFLKDWGREIRARGFDGRHPVLPVLMSRSTGHGVGKSALGAMAVDFIMSTRPMSKGTITANTQAQLETKTWAELVKWTRMCKTRHWWKITSGRGSMRMRHYIEPENWRCDGIAWSEDNAEAFAGQHAADGSPFYLFDEGSAIADVIFTTAMGGMTDGEPFMIVWGNPTRTSGKFYDIHHKERRRWLAKAVDSRTARKTNKELIAQWAEDYGEDSDFFKVRVRGMFPSQGSSSLIPMSDIEAGFKRSEYSPNPTDPLIIGVDPARFGDDQTVIRVRQGFDAKTHKPLRFSGLDTMQVAGRVAQLASELLPDAIFVDEGGLGAGVVDRLHQLNIPRVFGVAFNNKSPQRGYANRASYMYGKIREQLKRGLAIEENDMLREDLGGREYYFDKANQIVLESKADFKERLGRSPDDGDALALTFADEVGPRDLMTTMNQLSGQGVPTGVDFDPMADRDDELARYGYR